MGTLAPWVEGYAIKFRQQTERAPAEQYRVFDMTAVHEEAIFSTSGTSSRCSRCGEDSREHAGWEEINY